MEILEFKDSAEFEKGLVKKIKKLILNSSDCKIGLSGGSTPWPIYKALANCDDIDFEKVIFFIVDERYVQEDDENSNLRMIKSCFEPVLAKGAKIIAYNTKLTWLECAQDYNEKLKNLAPEGLDLIILGMGEDGHIASAFPKSEALDSEENVVTTTTENFAVNKRIGMTVKYILKSKEIILLLKGEKKGEALKELIKGNMQKKDFPAKYLKGHDKVTIYYAI